MYIYYINILHKYITCIYIKSLVEKELRKVKFSYKVGNKQQKEKWIPFVLTKHPILEEYYLYY